MSCTEINYCLYQTPSTAATQVGSLNCRPAASGSRTENRAADHVCTDVAGTRSSIYDDAIACGGLTLVSGGEGSKLVGATQQACFA